MPKNLTTEECAELGIKFPCNQMDNGEYRFRCMNVGRNSGYGYILIKMPDNDRGWQNSHYHQGVMETYIVQEGWIGLAEELPDSNVVTVRVYIPGDIFTTKPHCAHNIYMAAGAVVHTVKHGDCSLEKDWFASPTLDEKTKHLSEADILSAC